MGRAPFPNCRGGEIGLAIACSPENDGHLPPWQEAVGHKIIPDTGRNEAATGLTLGLFVMPFQSVVFGGPEREFRYVNARQIPTAHLSLPCAIMWCASAISAIRLCCVPAIRRANPIARSKCCRVVFSSKCTHSVTGENSAGLFDARETCRARTPAPRPFYWAHAPGTRSVWSHVKRTRSGAAGSQWQAQRIAGAGPYGPSAGARRRSVRVYVSIRRTISYCLGVGGLMAGTATRGPNAFVS
jgi:hypothetical protein